VRTPSALPQSADVAAWVAVRPRRAIAGSNRDLPSSSAIPLKADVQRGAGLLLVFLGHAVLGVIDFAVEVGRLAPVVLRAKIDVAGFIALRVIVAEREPPAFRGR